MIAVEVNRSKAEGHRTLVFLLVEDNEGDVYLVREALAEAGFPNVLHVVREGDAALAFLRGKGMAAELRPDLIILDLNLPGKNGRQVMAEMEAEPALRGLPVAVLSTSSFESGIGREFPGLRSTFAAKTSDFMQLVDIMRRFRVFALQPVP